jgi:hypothetical protein
MSSNAYVYLSSVPVADPEEGWFARRLRHDCSGVRYREPIAAERSSGSNAYRRAGARKLVSEDKPSETAPQTLWPLDRIAKLPRTSGKLTRIGDVIEKEQRQNRKTGKVRVEYYVSCACECGNVIKPQVSTWLSLSRPQSCRPCSYNFKRRRAAFTDKGYQQARDFVAAERERAA